MNNSGVPGGGRFYHEAERDVPIVHHADVVVCGAGPAGVAAALAAARAGARTCLLEVHGCLGGVWTAGLLSWVIGAEQPGIMMEIMAELDRRGARGVTRRNRFSYDAEAMKLLLEQLCAQAGVTVQLHTRVVAAGRDANNRLAVAVTESKSGRQAWAAKVFIDCTGDGDLAHLAGCGVDLGHPETGQTQPMSLVALVTGVHADLIRPFVGGGLKEPKKRLLAEIQRAGVEPSYEGPTLFPVRDELFALMANHEYGASAMDAAQVTAATLQARGEVHRIVEALRALGEPWADLRIVATGEQIGVREGRRIHGQYTVTRDDLLAGRRHDDAVCRVSFGMDIHSVDPRQGKVTTPQHGARVQPYDIPLRALIAKDVDGLMMAGRCISGDFFAHASYRITGTAVAMGQAAGVAAAVAAATDRSPRDVPWAEVREALDAARDTGTPSGVGDRSAGSEC